MDIVYFSIAAFCLAGIPAAERQLDAFRQERALVREHDRYLAELQAGILPRQQQALPPAQDRRAS